MASNELFDISRSKTFLSRLASAANSEAFFVGLSNDCGGEVKRPGDANDVSMVGRSAAGLAKRGGLAVFSSSVKGEVAGAESIPVAERLLDCWEFPESMDDKLVDLRCKGPRLGLRGTSLSACCGMCAGTVGETGGRVPNICDAPLR